MISDSGSDAMPEEAAEHSGAMSAGAQPFESLSLSSPAAPTERSPVSPKQVTFREGFSGTACLDSVRTDEQLVDSAPASAASSSPASFGRHRTSSIVGAPVSTPSAAKSPAKRAWRKVKGVMTARKAAEVFREGLAESLLSAAEIPVSPGEGEDMGRTDSVWQGQQEKELEELHEDFTKCSSFSRKEYMCKFRRRQGSYAKEGMHHRIVDRDGPFGQSTGHWELTTLGLKKDSAEREVIDLFLSDWYHTFLDAKLPKQMLVFAVGFIIWFGIFAWIFLLISEPCGLNLEGSFVRAYLLSVETMMTIGYGVPDPYMKGCWAAPLVLTVQSLLQLLMSACLVGVVFQGISRPTSRAATVIFSDYAVIQERDGALYFMFRLCDLRMHSSLIEGHIRCYCLNRHTQRGYELTPLRLLQPDDDLGANLLPNFPCLVVHRIDAWSPLAPQTMSGGRQADMTGTMRKQRREQHRVACWPAPPERIADCEAGNRQSCVCPTCGEEFSTLQHLQLHCQYNATSDTISELPPEARHWALPAPGQARELSPLQPGFARPVREEEEEQQSGSEKWGGEDCEEDHFQPAQRIAREVSLGQLGHKEIERETLREHFRENFLEVVVLVEGIEPTSSSTLQCRHSYVIGGPEMETDVVWDLEFADCMRAPPAGAPVGGNLLVDLNKFHKLEKPHRKKTNLLV